MKCHNIKMIHLLQAYFIINTEVLIPHDNKNRKKSYNNIK